MANAVEQALLLLEDMANLRSLRRHEVFLSLKKDLTMVSLSINPLPPLFFASFLRFLPFTISFFSPLPVSFLGRLFKPRSGQRR